MMRPESNVPMLTDKPKPQHDHAFDIIGHY